MDLVTLKPWVYPETFTGELPYIPEDAVGRLAATGVVPTPKQEGVYTPEKLVENYNSLVWKEGFRSAGDFELKTHDIQATLNLLPKGTLVSLRDSNEVCVVTTHHIGTDEEDNDVLTVTGKNLLIWILENRPTWAYGYGPETDDVNAAKDVNLVFKIPDHLAFILWAGIVFPHSEGGYPITKKRFELPHNIIVPHTAVSVSVYEKGDYYRTKWPPPMETRLDSASGLLDLDQDYGMRVIRPRGVSASIYRPLVNSLRGEGNTTPETNIDKMLFDVYQGTDRTLDDANRVVFRYDAGDIESMEYISSIDGSKNVVVVHTEVDPTKAPFVGYNPPYMNTILWTGDAKVDINGVPQVTNPEHRKKLAGLGFRFGEVTSSANVKETGITTANLARIDADGTKYLRENKPTDIMTADISPYSNIVFKKHYNLGDIVWVHGKYGPPQKMVVSEYTRTEETTGETGFPTLIKWEEQLT